MTTQEWQVEADDDDAYTNRVGTRPPFTYNHFPNDAGCYYGYNYLHGSMVYCSGHRFLVSGIPQGQKISSAFFKIIPDYRSPSGDIKAKLYGEDVDSPLDFNAVNPHCFLRTKTTANILFDHTGTEAWKTSDDIKTIIQELVDRPGWDETTLTILYHNITMLGGFGYSYAHEPQPTYAAKLEITWVVPEVPAKPLINKPLVNPILINAPCVR